MTRDLFEAVGISGYGVRMEGVVSYLVVQPFAWPRDVDGPATPAVRGEAAAVTRQLAPGE
ncbi:hypothetical protein [Frankia sp. Cr1]|uniref:hypothetical protein n=1 Tax=Frankia sp. Cr1 TaxID=3073931 RepID=UPI002AD5130A|nr:hypothetical protein [Frankia sp. Cr1]